LQDFYGQHYVYMDLSMDKFSRKRATSGSLLV